MYSKTTKRIIKEYKKAGFEIVYLDNGDIAIKDNDKFVTRLKIDDNGDIEMVLCF